MKHSDSDLQTNFIKVESQFKFASFCTYRRHDEQRRNLGGLFVWPLPSIEYGWDVYVMADYYFKTEMFLFWLTLGSVALAHVIPGAIRSSGTATRL